MNEIGSLWFLALLAQSPFSNCCTRMKYVYAWVFSNRQSQKLIGSFWPRSMICHWEKRIFDPIFWTKFRFIENAPHSLWNRKLYLSGSWCYTSFLVSVVVNWQGDRRCNWVNRMRLAKLKCVRSNWVEILIGKTQTKRVNYWRLWHFNDVWCLTTTGNRLFPDHLRFMVTTLKVMWMNDLSSIFIMSSVHFERNFFSTPRLWSKVMKTHFQSMKKKFQHTFIQL